MLCTMCSVKGVNINQIFKCSECGEKCCRHTCRGTPIVCDLCISKKTKKEGEERNENNTM